MTTRTPEMIERPYCLGFTVPHKVTNVLCPDGKYRTILTAIQHDTYFSIPGRVRYRGKTVSGAIMFTHDENYNSAALFLPDRTSKNGGLFVEKSPSVEAFLDPRDKTTRDADIAAHNATLCSRDSRFGCQNKATWQCHANLRTPDAEPYYCPEQWCDECAAKWCPDGNHHHGFLVQPLSRIGE